MDGEDSHWVLVTYAMAASGWLSGASFAYTNASTSEALGPMHKKLFKGIGLRLKTVSLITFDRAINLDLRGHLII